MQSGLAEPRILKFHIGPNTVTHTRNPTLGRLRQKDYPLSSIGLKYIVSSGASWPVELDPVSKLKYLVRCLLSMYKVLHLIPATHTLGGGTCLQSQHCLNKQDLYKSILKGI